MCFASFRRSAAPISWTICGRAKTACRRSISDGLDRVRAAALREITVEEFAGGGEEKRACRRVRVKTHDKIAALDRLARHHGLYREPEMPQGVPRHDARQVARAVLALMREVSIAGA